MELKKYSLVILSISLILLVFVSSASAADTNKTDVISIDESANLENNLLSIDNNVESNELDNNTLKVSNDEVLAAGNNYWYVNESVVSGGNGKSEETAFNTLAEAIGESGDNDIIMIASGVYTGTENIDLVIKKPLNFKKYGDSEAIFDAQGLSRIWTVTASSINITGLTFKNGKADNGGAIYFGSDISNSNINASFINNTANGQYTSDGGGANYFSGSVSGSNIGGLYTNNAAGSGGANYFSGSVSGSNITGAYTNNKAEYYGGANYFENSVSGSNITGTYANNTAENNDGGANYFWASVSCSNITGTFTNNAAWSGGANYFNGGFSGSNITGTYANNKAEYYGGANYFSGSVSGSNVSGEYISNTAEIYGGGANYFWASVSGSNITGTFTNNAAWSGGANYFYRVSDSNITGTYSNNTAANGDGGANYFSNSVSDSNVGGTYINNTAENNDGGANYFWASVSGSNITGTYSNNTAARYGGANYFRNAVEASNVSGTYVNNIAELYDGGANLFRGNVSGSSVGGTYANNAAWSGGANYFENSVLGSNITGTYSNNTANGQDSSDGGGANYFSGSVSGSNVSGEYINNTAASRGGANYFSGSVSDSNVGGIYINNKAESNGGANYFSGSVSDSNITGTYSNNKAENNDGGANYFWASVSGSNITGTFTNNAAWFGGANYFSGSVSGSNVGGTYVNNIAELYDGGANYFWDSFSDSNVAGTYSNNTAARYGGANYFWTSVLGSNITGTYSNNKAESNGGANYFSGSVSDSNITGTYSNNKAENNDGGANYFRASVSGSNITGTYSNNTAASRGGANYFENSVSGSNITGTYANNTAENNDGGANYFWASVSCSNITGTFTNNAAWSGGANYFNGGFSGSNITGTYANNKAESNGGANCFWNTVSGSNVGGTYVNNIAELYDGGANFFGGSVSGSNITGTYSNNKADYGGANNFENSVSGSNITGTYTNNTAWSGGANNFENSVSVSNITGTYSNNKAESNGGANNFDSRVSDSNVSGTYSNNKAEIYGGANYFSGSVSGSNIIGTYSNNKAEYYGGANYFSGSVSGSNVSGEYISNTAEIYGGGANYFENSVSGSNITGTFTNNTADYGGANYFENSVSGSNITGTYSNNTADYGGANYFKSVSDSNVGGTYINNTAKYYGGANYFWASVSGSNITGTFTNNAAWSGGANYFNGGVSGLNVTGVYINNTASNAIIHFEDYNNEGFDADITNAIFLNNNCTYEIYARTQVVVVKDSWFGNNASNYMNEPNINDKVTIDNWLFLNATADNASLLVLDSSNITFKLYSTDGTNVFDFDNSKLPVVNLTLTATNGDVDDTTTLDNVVEYVATERGKGSVTASIEDAEYTIFLDNIGLNPEFSAKVIPQEIDYGENTTIFLSYNNTATGTVNITLKSKNYNKTVKMDINQTITIADLPVGEYNVAVEYLGDNLFSNATAYANFTVEKITTEVIPDKDTIDLFVDDEYKITYALKPDYALGNISFSSNDSDIASVDSVSGDILAKAEGSATITVSFSGSENYTASNATITVNVKRIPTQITVNSSSIDMKVNDEIDIGASLEPANAGNLTYKSSDDNIVKVENGKIKGLKEGNATITLSFAGNKNYAAAENKTINVTVNELIININAENLTKYYSSPKPFVVNITDSEGNPIAGEKLSITINGVDYNRITDENGIATLNITLISGVYPVNVRVKNATANATVTVLTTINGSDIRKVFRDDTTYNVTVLDSEGNYLEKGKTVEFNVNGNIYEKTVGENGLAIWNVDLPAGDYVVTATNTVTGENTANNITVLKAESEITMYARNITDRDADAIIATIILPGSATGNVSVTIGDNTTVYDIDSSDHTSRGGKTFMFIRNNGLNAGQYNISATYEGDENYNPSGENGTFVVSKTKEDLNVSLYADPITIGQDAVVEMTGLANATGNITLTVDGREYQFPIVDSEMGFGIPGLFENTTAVFTYPGDENYNNFTESVDIIVNRIDSNISFHLNDIFEGEESTTYLRLPSFITGNITVILNGNARTFDIADAYVFPMDGYLFVLVTYENLTVGNYNFTAIYHGDEYFAPSNGSGKFVVFPKENVTMNISASPVIEGENVTIEIEFPDDAISATVTAVVDGKNFTAQVIDPNIKINLPALPAGNYTIPVIYSGNYKYYPLIEEVNITVESKPCIINAPDVTKYFGGPERFVVTVTDYRGNPLANKTVAVDINGVSYVRNTGVNGTASFPLVINSGIYNVTSAVDNQSVNSVVTVLPTVNAADLVKVFRNATQFYATFLDSQGNYLAKGTVITFNINGVFYNRTVDENGLAKLNINLNQGKYIITSINTVTGENTANNVTVIPRIIENSDITKYYRNATQYTVKLIGDDGKAVGAGEIVTFNINGVLYNRTTNESGIAKLNINLQPGDYIITAEYKGCMVANNIKVLPILNATDISMKYRDGTQFKATLVDGQGKPYAGQSVTFNINGVFYNRVTDSSGMAKLNINLMPGEYIITSSYNGTAIANKITIKS